MTDRLDALIAMVAQNIQTDNDECVDEINRIGRARAEYLQDFIRRLDGLRHIAADELRRVQHFLPQQSTSQQRVQPQSQEPVPRIVHKGPANG
jgi:hypothetical protein